MCFFKPNTETRHISHLDCVCVFSTCLFSMDLSPNIFGQESQTCVFSPWRCMWTFKKFLLFKIFEHISHTTGSFRHFLKFGVGCLTLSALFWRLVIAWEEPTIFSAELGASKTKKFSPTASTFSCFRSSSCFILFILGRGRLVICLPIIPFPALSGWLWIPICRVWLGSSTLPLKDCRVTLGSVWFLHSWGCTPRRTASCCSSSPRASPSSRLVMKEEMV